MRAVVVPVLTLLLSATGAGPAHADDGDWRHRGSSYQAPDNEGGVVRDVRFAAHPGFDRIVVDLSGPVPDYYLRYRRTFRYEGTGDPVPIRGASGLVLSLGADGSNDWGKYLYTGPRIARPHLATLKALAMIGDSEGWGAFAFALRHRASYRTTVLSDPSRIVIDFRHR